MKEIISLRKPREKHFLNDDGTITMYVYNHDVHYLKNENYEEIDNTLIEKEKCYQNKLNSFHISFFKDNPENRILKVEEDNYFLEYFLEEQKHTAIKKENQDIIYEEILSGIDLKYTIIENKLKDFITIKEKDADVDSLKFKIKTNLNLILKNNDILVQNEDKIIYIIECPILFDINENYHDIKYDLEKVNDYYYLSFKIEKQVLEDENLYPLIIDPVITNKPSGNVYDTYIFPGDENINRNNTDILKVGVDSNNKIYRTLLKFDLPVIGTACEIVNAYGVLTSHATNYVFTDERGKQINIDVHRILTQWTEESANWNTMNNQYDPKVESYFCANRSDWALNDIALKLTTFDITNLVKRWYAGEANNGLMLKFEKEFYSEDYKEHSFYSKNNTVTSDTLEDPKPYLVISYRNFNGLENYMTYQIENYSLGKSYINYLTGNLTNVFEINKTIGKKSPISLSLIYNTNDIVLNNNFGMFIGYKWNYYQTITEIKIEDIEYLEFLDSDGSLHYFPKIEEEFHDEDGLNLTIKLENSNYIMMDKNGNRYLFSKMNSKYYLTEIIDSFDNHVKIIYENGKIVKIIDADNQEIIISYTSTQITITSPHTICTLKINNDLIQQIETKFGTVKLEYNSKKIVTMIIDINKKTKFEYYEELPYRIKKISELGMNDTEGNTLEYIYGFLVTRLKDQKGRVNTYTFNNQGNTIGITSLKSNDDFIDSYGFHKEFDTYNETSKNKLLIESSASKYTNNLFPNHSFEDTTVVNYDKGKVVNYGARNGDYCLKITEITKITLPEIREKNTYTFSGYFKNNNKMNIAIINNRNEIISELKNISINNEYYRVSITGELQEDAYYIIVEPIDNAVIYLDDIQFEIGIIANYINIVENSDFSRGFTSWTRNASDMNGNDISNVDEIVTLNNGVTAYKRNNKPNHSIALSQTINYSGKKNETYKLSFWYKNEGIVQDDGDYTGNLVFVNFKYKEEIPGDPFIYHLNIHATEWQYFEMTFTTKADYEKVYLEFVSQNEVNDFYVTHITLTKDLEINSYIYDEHGNLKSSKDQTNGVSKFSYDNNQISKILTPKGNHFEFEYDNEDATKLIQGISSNGIANIIEYDEFKNPIHTIIKKVKDPSTLEEYDFFIRRKGTKEYLFININSKELEIHEPVCHIDSYKLEKYKEHYILKTSLLSYYFEINLENSKLILESEKEQATLFDIVLNENGSYAIKLVDKEECLTFEDNTLSFKQYNYENVHQQFYFEISNREKYIETKSEYTSDGKFVSKTIDALGKEKEFDYDQNTGLLKSLKDVNGIITNYIYDDKERITKVKKGNREVCYSYNNYNLLSAINCGNKYYYFDYDEFLNMKKIKLNDNTLIDYAYESNDGNMVNAIYGNGSKILYEYDEIDRIKSVIQNNKKYEHYYNNMNDLVKILSTDETYNYYYDFAGRLSKYELNGNSIDYEYDTNSNVTNRVYHYQNLIKDINYIYDRDDTILGLILDGNKLNYVYDDLGRLQSKNINNRLSVEYEYYSLGNKTSNVLKSIEIDNDLYEYVYDNIYNITHIYKNQRLTNHYEYNNLNELIQEDNYILGRTYKYKYDNFGNILTKKEYWLEEESLINEYSYDYGNENWKDQLTSFNHTNILYDEIGNPIHIGNDILSWNGRELQGIIKNNLNVYYNYDKDGIRIQKNINNTITKYFTENSNIIFEETDSNVLYYIRDDNNNLIGFTYNDTMYYYKKNLHEDIIGIYDKNYQLIVTYDYDSWGKILNVKDQNGNEITDVSHIAHINPFRYRSYYYDKETGLYYLNSRYYNPEWGRFLNVDKITGEIGNVLSHNLYQYAFNNPITYNDEIGNWPNWVKTVAKVAVGLAIVTVGTAIAVASGVTAGVAIAAGIKTAVTVAAVSSGVKAVTSAAKSWARSDPPSKILENTVTGAIDGFSNGFLVGSATFCASAALLRVNNGGPTLSLGDTPKEKTGRIEILYGKTDNSNTYNTTIFAYNNSSGSSRFRLETDNSNFLHTHFGLTNKQRGKHRKTIVDVIFGIISGLF